MHTIFIHDGWREFIWPLDSLFASFGEDQQSGDSDDGGFSLIFRRASTPDRSSSPRIRRPRRGRSPVSDNDNDDNNSDTDSSFSDDSLFSVESYDKEYETISCLLASKRKRKKAQKALFRAVRTGTPNDIGKALANGAFIDDPNALGLTPLAEDFGSRQYDNALFLIEYGANISGADFYGNTYLHRAVEAGQINIVRALYERNADPHAENRPLKRTPLSIARQLLRNDIVKILLTTSRKKAVNL